jgi:hypothetical protein
MRKAERARCPVLRGDQATVLHHAVVVQRHGHEDHVAACPRAEPVEDVGNEAELGFAQGARPAEPAFGEDGLGHARLGRHLHVARQHLAVERIVVAAPDEIAPHGADERSERPDPRPFAHRVGQRRAFGHEPCDQHVVHVRAVVHHEDDGRVLGDRRQRRLVVLHEAHAVERLAEEPRGADGEGEIGEGGKARHDLARVAFGGLEGHVLAHVLLVGVLGDRLRDLGVVDQAARYPCGARA